MRATRPQQTTEGTTMGWSYWRDDRPTAEIVTELLERSGTYRVVAHSGKYWAVCERETGNVTAFVMLTRRSRSDGEFGYKSIHESSGPIETKCPMRILNMLSATTDEYALEWRQKCRDNATAATGKTLHKGTRIRFGHNAPEFSNGKTAVTGEFLGGYRLRVTSDDGTTFTASMAKNWRDIYEWEIMA